MNKKTAVTIIIVVLLVLALGFGLFYFFFLKNTSTPNGPTQNPSFGPGLNPSNPIAVNPPINNPTGQQGTSTRPLPKLRQISSAPTAGAVAFDISSTTSKGVLQQTLIRYIESATGHIDQTQTNTLDTKKISLTTIPKLYEAVWQNDGSASYMRYLEGDSDNIETYYGKLALLPGQSAPTSFSSTSTSGSGVTYAPYETKGNFIPINIGGVVVPKDKTSLFYIQEKENGSEIISAKADSTQATILLDSPLKEWLISWVNDNTLALTTKPSASSDGYFYFLNTSSGRLDRILGKMPGLTALSDPVGQEVLFSETDGVGGIDGGLYNTKTGSIGAFAAATLPEKCVWSEKDTTIIYCAVPTSMPSANYPDAWYQGIVSFTDDFWKINTQTGTTTLVANPQNLEKVAVDGTHLFLDPRENYLFFTNKKDNSLWSIDLNQ